MTQLTTRSFLWMAPALLLAAGCGETQEPDPCAEVTCGSNAQCSAGACVCDDGFTGDATAGCTAEVACTDTSCSGNGACDASSGAIACTCDEGWDGATCATCADGFALEGDACVAADLCEGLSCANGSCVIDAGAASCECQDGWAGELCDGCADGYTLEGEACINEKQVDCSDVAPENGTSEVVPVTVTWDAEAEAFTEPAACEWACDVDFDEFEGACINTRTESCDASGTAPDNAEFVVADVEVSFTTADGWAAAPACAFECDADFAVVGEACANEQQVDCTDVAPDNASSTVAQVTITYSDADGWTEASACEWACDTDFDGFEGACINTRLESCDASGTAPANATFVVADVEVSFTTAGGWAAPAVCGFVCDADFANVGDACVNEQQVDCTDAAPANATSTVAQVTVTYTDADGWTEAAACEWTCDTDYVDFDEQGACINSREVACDGALTPENATATPANVTVTYTTDAGWTDAAACEWTCDSGYVADGAVCIPAVAIDACNVTAPATITAESGVTTQVFGRVSASGTVDEGQLAGLQARLCFTSATLAAPVDVTALNCVDATFDSDDGSYDLYVADATFTSAGTYSYVYAFSGDSGLSWSACDLDGVVAETVNPGVATIAPGTAEQIAAVRATEGEDLSLAVDNATVTYVRSKVGNEDAGFFVQATKTGPAVFIAGATTAVVGDQVSVTVTAVDQTSHEQVIATIDTDHDVFTGAGDVPALVQDLTDATDVVTAVGDYDSELVKVTGTIASTFSMAGTDFSGARFDTAGVQDDLLKIRLPDTLLASTGLEPGCTVTVTGPLLRFDAEAQVNAYTEADLTDVTCPGPSLVGAEASANTTVVLTFDKDIDPELMLEASYHILFDPELDAVDATVAGNKITVTTSAQTEGTVYTVLVADLYDLNGNLLEGDTATFTGVAAGTDPVCEWTPDVVISQVHGGGGNSGATYSHDFVELHNRSDVAVDVSGWSVQYASSSGTSWQAQALSGSIAAGGFYLVQLGEGSGGVSLPTADVSGGIAMSGSKGKVALVSSTTELTGSCPLASTVDFVGYGSANCFEGSDATPSTSGAEGVKRTDACVDTNDNLADFVKGEVTPRNSASTAVACVCE